MQRRSFIKSILLGLVAPTVLVSKLEDHQKWKRTDQLWTPNPEWVDAPYEVAFLSQYERLPWYLAKCEVKHMADEWADTWKQFAEQLPVQAVNVKFSY